MCLFIYLAPYFKRNFIRFFVCLRTGVQGGRGVMPKAYRCVQGGRGVQILLILSVRTLWMAPIVNNKFKPMKFHTKKKSELPHALQLGYGEYNA